MTRHAMRATPMWATSMGGAALALVALAVPTGPALAQGFEPPPGCEGVLTVQMRGCMLTNHFVCEGDPEGVRRHITFREGGASGASVVDREYQWLETYGAERREVLGEDVPDPASLTELFATGVDTFDFPLVDSSGPEERTFRVIGVDELQGEQVEIDGEPLERTRFAMKRLDEEGTEIYSVTGEQYVSRDRRLFFAGTETLEIGGRTVEGDNTPVRFIEPGEPGFMAEEPLYGCNATDIRFVPGDRGASSGPAERAGP